jgi:hypothetical protein
MRDFIYFDGAKKRICGKKLGSNFSANGSMHLSLGFCQANVMEERGCFHQVFIRIVNARGDFYCPMPDPVSMFVIMRGLPALSVSDVFLNLSQSA